MSSPNDANCFAIRHAGLHLAFGAFALGLACLPCVATADDFVPLQAWSQNGAVQTVELLVQVDFQTQLTLENSGRHAFILPLLAVPDGKSDPDAVIGALVFDGRMTLDDRSLDRLLADTRSMAARGPVVGLTLTPLATSPFEAPLRFELGDRVSGPVPIFTMDQPPAIAGLSPVNGLGALLSTGALVVTLRKRRRTHRAEHDAAEGHVTLAPYEPEMVSDADARDALQKSIQPVGGSDQEPPVYRVVNEPAIDDPIQGHIGTEDSNSLNGGYSFARDEVSPPIRTSQESDSLIEDAPAATATIEEANRLEATNEQLHQIDFSTPAQMVTQPLGAVVSVDSGAEPARELARVNAAVAEPLGNEEGSQALDGFDLSQFDPLSANSESESQESSKGLSELDLDEPSAHEVAAIEAHDEVSDSEDPHSFADLPDTDVMASPLSDLEDTQRRSTSQATAGPGSDNVTNTGETEGDVRIQGTNTVPDRLLRRARARALRPGEGSKIAQAFALDGDEPRRADGAIGEDAASSIAETRLHSSNAGRYSTGSRGPATRPDRKPRASVVVPSDVILQSAEVKEQGQSPRVRPVSEVEDSLDAEALAATLTGVAPSSGGVVADSEDSAAGGTKRPQASTLFAAARLGESSRQDLGLTAKESKRVDRDPFVKRLSQLG
ncbi:MAG: hypothetical protein AAFU56_04325 [Pseudomonadota bacterium]